MRIVHVVLSLGLGGQERLLVALTRAMRARGHDPHVVSFAGGGALRDAFGPVPVHEIPRREGLDLTLVPRLVHAFRRIRPDVVHTHNAAPLVYATPAARLSGVATVVHTKHGEAPYTRVSLRLARATSGLADHFVAVSEATAVAAARLERPPPSRLRVVENGIPLDAFRPDPAARVAVRSELGIPEDACVVGSVGRMVYQKDVPLLVRAAAPLLSDRVRLVLVGDGPERAAAEAAIPPAARPFVHVLGARSDVPRLLASFDVFASTSRWEGLPLALAEAMTAGLPVVATAVGGNVAIVPPEAGLLVAHGDERGFRDALASLAADPAKRRRMGESGRAKALARFSDTRMVDDYLALYARREEGACAAR